LILTEKGEVNLMKKINFTVAVLLVITIGCLGGEAEAPVETKPAVNIELGSEVFANNCRICHGFEGKGNPEIGASDLTSAEVKSLSREKKIDQVTNGGTNMPPFGQTLSEEEINAVVGYIATL
jgi:cytochrome c oxidase cbb3-type subunit 3